MKGIKFGFVQIGNQHWSTWLHDAVRKCAEYEMMVDIHDEYRPTGFSRTYPNLMTQEGIGGNEEMPDATHNTILPYTRFLAGAGDYTLCYFNGRVKTQKHINWLWQQSIIALCSFYSGMTIRQCTEGKKNWISGKTFQQFGMRVVRLTAKLENISCRLAVRGKNGLLVL